MAKLNQSDIASSNRRSAKAVLRSKFNGHVLWLTLVALAMFAAGTVIAIGLSSIQESFSFSVKPITTTTIAPIDTVQVPSFIDPLPFFAISRVFIGVFFTVGLVALLSAFRKRRASKNEPD